MRTSTGMARVLFSVSAILVAGLAATALSGEFLKSWTYLIVDVAEACAGFACAVAASRLLRWAKNATTPARF
ncbi:MAG: hypothetical protein WBX18_11630 [Terracidiphilus sp.]